MGAGSRYGGGCTRRGARRSARAAEPAAPRSPPRSPAGLEETLARDHSRPAPRPDEVDPSVQLRATSRDRLLLCSSSSRRPRRGVAEHRGVADGIGGPVSSDRARVALDRGHTRGIGETRRDGYPPPGGNRRKERVRFPSMADNRAGARGAAVARAAAPAGGRPVQPCLDADRANGSDPGAGRRDASRRPCVPLPLERGRDGERTSAAASGRSRAST